MAKGIPGPPNASGEETSTQFGGVLTGDQIIHHNLVHDKYSEGYLRAASYDLRLGSEVFYCGRGNNTITRLGGSGDALSVEIKPFETIIFSTLEVIKTPPNIVGRFDLKIGRSLEGLILQVGPQVEPMYEGPLFGLLLNASGRGISLNFNESFLTIEFHFTGEYYEKMPRAKTIASLTDFIVTDQNMDIGSLTSPAQFIEKKLKEIRDELNSCKTSHGIKTKVQGARNIKWTLRWTIVGVLLAFVLGGLGVFFNWGKVVMAYENFLQRKNSSISRAKDTADTIPSEAIEGLTKPSELTSQGSKSTVDEKTTPSHNSSLIDLTSEGQE